MSGLQHLALSLLAYGLLGVGIGMLLESACVPLPSEVVLPFAGFLVATGRVGFAAAFGAAVAGGLAGSLLSYWVGRYGGRPALVRWGRGLRFGEHELATADRWFERHGQAAVFWGRLLPGVRTFISLPAGVAEMPVWRFVLYSLLGSLPWTAVLIVVGMELGTHWNALAAAFHRFEVGVVVLVAVALGCWWLAARRARVRAEGGPPGS